MNDLTAKDWDQISQVALGRVAGTLADHPELYDTLLKVGIQLPRTDPVAAVKEWCIFAMEKLWKAGINANMGDGVSLHPITSEMSITVEKPDGSQYDMTVVTVMEAPGVGGDAEICSK